MAYYLRRRRVLMASIGFALAGQSFAQSGAYSDTMVVLRQRLVSQLRADPVAPALVAMRSTLAPDGHWNDIDYGDRSPGNWTPQKHLDRVAAIARQCDVLEEAHDPDALSCARDVERALEFWIKARPQSSNWWNNQIGQQLKLGVPLLLLPKLSPAVRSGVLSLFRSTDMVAPNLNTGQNRVWFAQQQLMRGLLAGQVNDVAVGSRVMQETLGIVTGEGWQVDHSFYQHGPQLYNLGYGLNLLDDTSRNAKLLEGTPWAFSGSTLQLMADHLLQGTSWMTWGSDWLDYSARGREIARPWRPERMNQLATTGRRVAELVGGPAAAALNAWADTLVPGNSAPATPLGVRAFWRGEYIVQRSPMGFVSVRASSSRTVGTEGDNGENLKGYWLPYGVHWVLSRGDEYMDTTLFDWTRLPGVTATDDLPSLPGKPRNASDFSAVLSDGKVGAAAFDESAPGVSVRKSWFLVGDTLIALGTDLLATTGKPLHTTVDQVRFVGNWSVNGHKASANAQSVAPGQLLSHGGTSYASLDGVSRIDVQVVQRTGHRADIDRAVPDATSQGTMISLVINHRPEVSPGGYAYVAMPGLDQGAALAWMKQKPWRVWHNDSALQAVMDAAGRTVMATVRGNQRLALPDGAELGIEGDVLMLAKRDDAGRWSLILASPRGQQSSTKFTWRLSNGQRGERTVSWPQGDQVGRSVELRL